MDTKDILTLVSIIVAALIGIIGFALTIWQVNKAKKIKEMDFVSSVISTIRTNANISQALYLIEYGSEWYDEKFHGSEIEKGIDALLSQFDYFCYGREAKLISNKTFSYFEYILHRIVNDSQVRGYLWNVYHWSLSIGQTCPFIHIINCMKEELTKEEIQTFNSEEPKGPYKKYLNF